MFSHHYDSMNYEDFIPCPEYPYKLPNCVCEDTATPVFVLTFIPNGAVEFLSTRGVGITFERRVAPRFTAAQLAVIAGIAPDATCIGVHEKDGALVIEVDA